MPLFPHKRLARHPGILRVEGIGPIRDTGGWLGLRAVVHFSRITERGIRDPYHTSARTEKSLKLSVHSASLHHFRVGTLWLDGKRIFGCPPLRKTFRIDAGRMRFVALGEAITLNGISAPTIVPINYLDVGETNRSDLARTLYGVVPVLDDPKTQWLVVPATELVRFYIGVSSRFMSGVLTGRLDNYIDWDASRVEDGIPIVSIHQRLSRKEAMVLARAVASRQAKSALLGVHQNLAAVHANNSVAKDQDKRPLLIKGFFPFSGTTELQVAGKPMLLGREGGRELWAVFAMELLTCSHPPDFDRFVLEGGDPTVVRTPGDPSGGGSRPPIHDPAFVDEEDNREVDDVPADKRLRRITSRTYTDQFLGFRRVQVEHRRPSAERPEGEPPLHVDVEVNSLTTGDGSGAEEAKGNLGVSEFQSKLEHVDDRLTLFLEMVQHLRTISESKGWEVVTRKLDDGIPRLGEWIALFPSNLGKKRSWHLIEDSKGTRRPRQVAWVEISRKDKNECFSLLEMELEPQKTGSQSTLLMFANDFTSIKEDLFRKLLLLTAIKNRWPAARNTWADSSHARDAQDFFSKVTAFRIPHPHRPRAQTKDGTLGHQLPVSPDAWSERLAEDIRRFIPEF